MDHPFLDGLILTAIYLLPCIILILILRQPNPTASLSFRTNRRLDRHNRSRGDDREAISKGGDRS
jgi:hypothetical protein